MSRAMDERKATRRPRQSKLFAALGDVTRLTLIGRLSGGEPQSIAQLTRGSRMTRQAITKHLRVLQRVGLVHSERAGRESRFALDPQPIAEMHEYLSAVSRRWDEALARLKSFVEE